MQSDEDDEGGNVRGLRQLQRNSTFMHVHGHKISAGRFICIYLVPGASQVGTKWQSLLAHAVSLIVS